ncbi:MAG: SDR family NAD(P)-dependent oxidoreductase [Cytophagales bacterium]|nr:SDR family NAD(P)-dependent oxidoreductase [Cytophagales bacterium]
MEIKPFLKVALPKRDCGEAARWNILLQKTPNTSIQMVTNSFEGKTALIIGGTSGMGKATAKLLLQSGAKVMVASKTRKMWTRPYQNWKTPARSVACTSI